MMKHQDIEYQDLYSKLKKEWHSKNENLLDSYTHGSQFRAWWLCPVCSHEWQTSIANRMGSRKSKCPNCKRLRFRGNTNPRWTGHGEISGRQWCVIKNEASEKRRNRRCKSHKALDFEITIEYAWNLFLKQDRKCALSGEPLTMWGKIDGKMCGNASLDRIDSSKGYIVENVQWIDKQLQPIKRNLPNAEFIAICKKIAACQLKKNKFPIPSFEEFIKKGMS